MRVTFGYQAPLPLYLTNKSEHRLSPYAGAITYESDSTNFNKIADDVCQLAKTEGMPVYFNVNNAEFVIEPGVSQKQMFRAFLSNYLTPLKNIWRNQLGSAPMTQKHSVTQKDIKLLLDDFIYIFGMKTDTSKRQTEKNIAIGNWLNRFAGITGINDPMFDGHEIRDILTQQAFLPDLPSDANASPSIKVLKLICNTLECLNAGYPPHPDLIANWVKAAKKLDDTWPTIQISPLLPIGSRDELLRGEPLEGGEMLNTEMDSFTLNNTDNPSPSDSDLSHFFQLPR